MGWLFFALLLCGIAWRTAVATRVWHDARQRGLTAQNSLRWVLTALVDAQVYWWGVRLDVMSADEAKALLRRTAQVHNLAHVTSIRCPLCRHEVTDALSVSEAGALIAAHREITCGRCDFRLDACRHCRHFLPASPAYVGPIVANGSGGDLTHGRCSRHRGLQPLRDTHPRMAQRLESMGYDYLPAPKRILDSFFPLEECTSFSLDLKRLRRSEIPWLTRQRAALIRLHERLNSGTRG